MTQRPAQATPSRARARRVRLRGALLVAASLIAGSLGGCRCKKETLAPVVFGDEGDREAIDPTQVLAPPWTPPAVSKLDNGAMLHWLREDGSPAFHLRLVLPTAIHDDKLTAAGTAAVLKALELRLEARLRRIKDAHLDMRSRPGRVELAIHGRDRDAELMIAALAQSLADAGNPKLLAVAQGKILARQGDETLAALGFAALSAELLDQPLSHEYADKDDIVELNKGRLDRSWSLLTDPRDAMLIVHAGRAPDDEAIVEALAELDESWKAPLLGLGSGKSSVTARLRPPPPKLERETRLLTEKGQAAMPYHAGEPGRGGRAEVHFGRLIPTPTAEDRTLARLCQRLLQEEIDARLVVAGPVSLLVVRVRVSPKDPVLSLERTVRRIDEFVKNPQPSNRLEQTANLWLGARMVEASLSGEDWTSLWSDSIDLAGEDREIFMALATDAQTMLQLSPEQVQGFFAKWFDPRRGEPGWTWVGVGIDDNFRKRLSERIELRPAE